MPDPEKVIVNTSPIFYLHRLHLIELLKKLYGTIIVPTAVVSELSQGKAQGADVPDLSTLSWIKVQNVKISEFLKFIPDLGPGEAEVLTLGLENMGSLIIIDDRLARHIAELQKLTFTGTADILLKAKHKGYIVSVSEVITQLSKLGFRISNRLKQDISRLEKEV
jgi:predicted nucleic acid-binding protein